MKVVILGGGIAGLCMGIYLQQNNIEVSINERQVFAAVGGHAFLMHHEGVGVLHEVAEGTECMIPGRLVDCIVFKQPDDVLITERQLEDWHCFKRTELLACLTRLFPNEHLQNDRVFSHFIYEHNKITAAAFTNGTVAYGDLFIGADGANSAVRQAILGTVAFKPGRVKEVVGIAEHPALAASLQGKFTKYQYGDRGLAFGLIPTSETEVVWFMQYDPTLADVAHDAAARADANYPEQLRELCQSLLRDFPAAVQAVLEVNDFTTSYIWNTMDFDLLPRFHQDNVVLIGDAAHVALPFTSAGTTNAMLDAKVLSDCLSAYADYETAFAEYYRRRAGSIAEHISLGRELRDAFLSPDAAFKLPLIKTTEQKV
jgi:FAD-dependent urate hydroxylase